MRLVRIVRFCFRVIGIDLSSPVGMSLQYGLVRYDLKTFIRIWLSFWNGQPFAGFKTQPEARE